MGSLLKRLRLNSWRRLLAAGALLFIVFNVLAVELSSQSWFCNSCHIMNSYYDSWKRSEHADVPCIYCHIEPGAEHFVLAKINGLGQVVDDILNRTSTKPSAAVSEFSCTRSDCHAIQELDSKGQSPSLFFFEHDQHQGIEFEGLTLNCTTCHSHVKGDRHFEVNTNVCITCHLIATDVEPQAIEPGAGAAGDDQARSGGSPGALRVQLAARTPRNDAWLGSSDRETEEVNPPFRCESCHEPPGETVFYRGLNIDHQEFLAFGTACESCHRNLTSPPDPIDDSQCFSCHDYGMERFSGSTRIHRTHAEGEHKVECFSCHGVTRHGPVAQAMRLDQLDCGGCHRDQHTIQRETYGVAGAEGHDPAEIAPAVSPMLLVHVDCTGCHIAPRPLSGKATNGATVAVAVPEACDACHQQGLGSRMIPLWQGATRELYENVLSLVPDDDDQLSRNDVARRLVVQANQLLDLVRLDGSWGVHNPRYTEALLERARSRLTEARRAIQDDEVSPP